MEEKEPDKRWARGRDHLLQQAWGATHHLQRKILALQVKRFEPPMLHHKVITIEKMYSSIKSGPVQSLGTTLKAINNTSLVVSKNGLPTTRVDSNSPQLQPFHNCNIDGVRTYSTCGRQTPNNTMHNCHQKISTGQPMSGGY